MYTEVTEIPPLSRRQQTLLEGHTLLNIYNVIRSELMQLGLALADNPNLLHASLTVCEEAIAGLGDDACLFAVANEVNAQEGAVFSEIDAQLRCASSVGPWVGGSVATLRLQFDVLRVRARELRLRSAADPWVTVPVAALEAEFRDTFAAIERSSHGRFRVVFNPATQRSADYYLELAIESGANSEVRIPAVFTDVMRDLLANARKYTPPGGRIRASLRSNGEGVRLVVEDNGRGIPAEEIPAVVYFGVRASNVSDVRTMGGGFGLTKAFVITKTFGGRFWIDSAPGRGTKIRIHVPLPCASAANGTAEQAVGASALPVPISRRWGSERGALPPLRERTPVRGRHIPPCFERRIERPATTAVSVRKTREPR